MTDIPVYTVEFCNQYGEWVQLARHEQLERAEDTYHTMLHSSRPVRIMYYPARTAQIIQGPAQ